MSDEISSLSEESEGEGPNIRPPQAHGASRKSHKYKYREADGEREGWRVERHREGRTDKPRGERRKGGGRGERDDRHRRERGGRRVVENNKTDLRYRLNSSRDKHRDSQPEERHRSGRDRDQERHHHDSSRSSRDDRSSNPSLSRMLEADKQHKRSRREVEEARRQRELLEKEMDIIAAKLKRKHKAKSRSPESSKKRRKSDSEEEEEGEDESQDDEESTDGRVSGSEESRSDITGSEKDEDTPDRDEESEEGELIDDDDLEEEQQEGNAEERSHSRSQTPIEGRWAEKSSSPERTPSRSPTPMKGEDEPMEEEEAVGVIEEAAGSPRSLSKPPQSPSLIPAVEAKVETVIVPSLPPYLPSVHGCRSVIEFDCLNRIEEGTYGVVYRAKDKRTLEIVALKKLKMEKEKEGFPITSLREINTLLISQHPNVVTVREIVVGSDINQIYIVMDFVEHDLKGLMETMRKKKQIFLPGEVKCLMKQLLSAIHHLHDNWILHRDLKSSNLLLSHNGILKVGDFGLAREYGSPLLAYTAIVVTLWYRAPELLMGLKNYSTHIDVWSIGCILGELLLMEPLFPGRSETDELNKIFKLLGTPSERVWSGFNNLPGAKVKFVDYPVSSLRDKFPERMLSEAGLTLLKELLTYDPKKRISCMDALKSSYFTENPQPIDPSMFPTWPAKSEQNPHDKLKKGASPKAPSGGHAFKSMQGDDDDERAVRSRGFNLLDNIQNRVPSAGFQLKF